MLPKRRRDFDPTPADDEYERVSVGEIQLVDVRAAIIIAPTPDPPSLSPMAVELEETVIALTRRREPAPPASTRPSVAWFATIFSVSTMLSLGATSILRTGEAPATTRTVAAEGIVASPPPPAAEPEAMAEADAGSEGASE